MAASLAFALKTLFAVLGCLVSALFIYTAAIDGGLPFRTELLTPWMVALLIDFFIHILAIWSWVVYKESNWTTSILWGLLLVFLGSIITSGYIVLQLLKLSTQESLQDPIYFVLLRRQKKWLSTTVIDFYVNVVALSVWVAYKESSWLSAAFWIILIICFGSISTCAYIALQLFSLSSQDPIYLVLFSSRSSISTCAYIALQLFSLSSQDPIYLVLFSSRSRKRV
ncbi:uncharacterized protein LOC132627400 isoform X5 [Lycium barbarum]|uniref:uncharacterized protein LOC132627400 isoform X5 n=1 Tax=Lycium barbarum TaxID=112863 RepID=UPI00293F2155|nr:uncharacterized protein LOC132627400 isoform X5 [Lycium barbarum]